ncbi:MAG: choice-of-anchor tandem repeat GloVer-containing protein [Candidatus Sulfotelmatobacter sp.]
MHLLFAKSSYIAIAFIVVSALFAAPPLARCQTETVLYSFSGKSGNGDGVQPGAGLTMDKAGNLYGTTVWGGDLSCNPNGPYPGCGTVFKLVPAGVNSTESVLYTFGTQSGDGSEPVGGSLVLSGTKLYGTTYIGGYLSCFSPNGCGTVFEVTTTTGAETPIYTFTSESDGLFPVGVIEKSGILYGTTSGGGPQGCGTVFQLTPPAKKGGAWTKTLLNYFGYQPDDGGCDVNPGLIYKDAVLYGTTFADGAYGGGAVFGLNVTEPDVFTLLYNFMTPPSDGFAPAAGLIMDSKGNIYGTTEYGGAYGSPHESTDGTVFELSAATGTETLLYSFGGYPGDGLLPEAGLIMYKSNLYGTTYTGGLYGQGTVFKLAHPVKKGAPWTETILHSFGADSDDGRAPNAGLIVDKKGNLYGTTTIGGAYGSGTVFEITP